MPHTAAPPPAFCAPTSLPLKRPPRLPARAHATYRVRYGQPSESRALIFWVSSAAPARPGARAATAAAAPPPPPSSALAADPEKYRLTAAVRARTVVHVCASGTLCTASARHAGAPFGSHADFILDEDGRPVFLLANNATHTKNLAENPHCSLYCQPPSTAGQDGCRATLVGSITPLLEDEVELKDMYNEKHTHAADALAYPDLFSYYRMEVNDVFFVGGYGVVSQWVDVAKFAEGEPDPLAFDAAGILAGINESKEDDLKRLSKIFLDVPDVHRCTMTSLDRLGFDLRVRDSAGEIREYRVAFREVVSNRFDVQSALVKAFQEAWERENGYDETWADEDTRATVLYYAPL